MLGIGAPTTTSTTTPLETVRSLRSAFPNPTNAQAFAALEAFVRWDARSLMANGVREDVAQSFALPDGVFPRMRLLAWGWTKQGDRFKSPSDTAWWKKTYQFPLWNPLETYIDQLSRSDVDMGPYVWNDDLASGDPAELSMSLPAVVQEDLPPVNEAPCPKWLIPPSRGQLPIPNPACLKKPLRDVIDRVTPQKGTALWPWLLLLGAVLLSRKGRR